MALSDIVNVQISLSADRVTREGFGMPLVLSADAAGVSGFTERIRYYSDINGVVEDFAVSTGTYLECEAVFSQNPRPPQVAVGRLANLPTQRFAITPTAHDATSYLVEIDGQNAIYTTGTMIDLPYTSQTHNYTVGLTLTGGTSNAKAIIFADTDGGSTGTLRLVGIRGTFVNGEIITDTAGTPGSATAGTPAAAVVSSTVSEVINGLRSEIDALGLAVTTSDQTTFLRVVANTAGAHHGLKVLAADTITKLKVAQDHVDPGLAADLSAIAAENSSNWYALLSGFNSKACVAAIATFTEANEKLYLADSLDSDIANLSATSDTGGSQTIAGLLKADNFFRTALMYHDDCGEFAAAAWAGSVLPSDPGSETWAFHTLAGVSSVNLTETQRTNILAKNANCYELVAGIAITETGKVSANEWIDVIRFRDWLSINMQADIFAAFTQASQAGRKVAYTDAGISIIQGIVLARLKAGVDVGGLSSSPAPTCTVPLVKNVSPTDKANRVLNNVNFSGILAGAIQAANLNGAITA